MASHAMKHKAEANDSPDEGKPKKRVGLKLRSGTACHACSRAKTKCEPGDPWSCGDSCRRCSRLKNECIFPSSSRPHDWMHVGYTYPHIDVKGSISDNLTIEFFRWQIVTAISAGNLPLLAQSLTRAVECGFTFSDVLGSLGSLGALRLAGYRITN